ncbi:hypothetical protein CDL15_Pgr005127 [Punica granatum]|nr:hypothetical protein CDL15_Pgr005127 [Punica granatum]
MEKEKGKEKEKEKKGKKNKEDMPAKESSQKERFADNVEIFPSSDGPSEGNARGKDQLVWGKRFSQEEDALIKEALYRFLEDHGLGEEGLGMVLHCRENAGTRHC